MSRSDDNPKRTPAGDAQTDGSESRPCSTEEAPASGRSQTKIRITEDAEATGDVLAAYDFWRKGSGRKRVPGIIKCFGARPDFLRQVIEFSNTVHFSQGHLNRRQKELIASYVSFLNECDY